MNLLRVAYSLEEAAWQALASAALDPTVADAVPVPGAGGDPGSAPMPAEVAMAFHPRTLAQVLFLRANLRPDDPTDRFLVGAMIGILHGRSPTYLSDIMPNTFAMAPRYVRDFVTRTGFQAAERDAFACLDAKLRRLLRQGLPAQRGIALLGDARDAGTRARRALRERALPDRARLVVASPPYLRVVKYGYYNWLRLWFMGIDPDAVDRSLDDAHQLDAYLVFMRQTLADLRGALTDDAIVVLVIGDVELDRGRALDGGIGLAETVWERAAAPEGYRLAGIALDDIAAQRKMTKIWGSEAGRTTKTDRLLVMAPTEQGRRRALAAASLPIDWSWPSGARLRAV
jgi:site-specific DNA-methyltransferase (adenine-specific)